MTRHADSCNAHHAFPSCSVSLSAQLHACHFPPSSMAHTMTTLHYGQQVFKKDAIDDELDALRRKARE